MNRARISLAINFRSLLSMPDPKTYWIEELRSLRIPVDVSSGIVLKGSLTHSINPCLNRVEFVWEGLEEDMLPLKPVCSICHGTGKVYISVQTGRVGYLGTNEYKNQEVTCRCQRKGSV